VLPLAIVHTVQQINSAVTSTLPVVSASQVNFKKSADFTLTEALVVIASMLMILVFKISTLFLRHKRKL